MKFSDGTLIHVGNTVTFSYGATGVVVASIDTDEYSEKYPREQWSYLKVGVLINCSDAGLMHFEKPEAGWVVANRSRQ